MTELSAKIAAWRSADPDPATVAVLDELVTKAASGDQGATAELASAFAGPLTFGTAGLSWSARPGAGPDEPGSGLPRPPLAWPPTCWTTATVAPR